MSAFKFYGLRQVTQYRVTREGVIFIWEKLSQLSVHCMDYNSRENSHQL